MLFGAISGSGTAAASAMGSIIGPIEEEEGYDRDFSAAANIATAPTGLLIPPRNVMITYSLVSGGTSAVSYTHLDVYKRQAMQKALIQTPGFEPERFYRMDAQLHSIWFGAVKRQTLWEMLQAQQLHLSLIHI